LILSAQAIEEAVETGDVVIDPFDRVQLSPNSYDFRLGKRCKMYRDLELDCGKNNATVDIEVGDDGLLVNPDRIYLFDTLEKMGSCRYVPIIRGRSSMGRLGLFIDITADLIDVGSINRLTLQLHSVMPVRVYPGMLIGQVTFWHIEGEINLYQGKYKSLESPVASLSYLDHGIKA
jgi:dCTP deaminase